MNNEREWEYKGNSEEQNLNNEIIIKGNKKNYFGLNQKINCLNNYYFFIFKFNTFKYLIIIFQISIYLFI